MSRVILTATLTYVAHYSYIRLITSWANAGRGDHSWQYAKDGSACGDRAADRRPGGR